MQPAGMRDALNVCTESPFVPLFVPLFMSLSDHAADLEKELAWLAEMIGARIRIHFRHECTDEDARDIREIAPPDLTHAASAYAQTVRAHAMSFDERLLLILALAPHLRPQALDAFLIKNPRIERGFTEFGGTLAGAHGGFWPTLETAAFILSANYLARRLALLRVAASDHFFQRRKILPFDDTQTPQRLFAAELHLSREYLAYLCTGAGYQPAFSSQFPAKRLTSALEWGDLVLADHVLEEVEEIRAWIAHRKTLLHGWQLKRRLKAGFRSLFYGPPGTGKTLTAALLGKSTGLDVYRVDLSLVVSKYIGETEKNLAQVFDQAESHDWILFFDEADALFGKRTQTASAHDRYANQEVSYLLQRIEDFAGVVILASNLKGNIDEAFARRFQSMVYFPMPGPEQRLQLWRNAFSSPCRLEPDADLTELAEKYELSGGAIINVLRFAALMALRRNAASAQAVIKQRDIRQGIEREFRKEGKMI